MISDDEAQLQKRQGNYPLPFTIYKFKEKLYIIREIYCMSKLPKIVIDSYSQNWTKAIFTYTKSSRHPYPPPLRLMNYITINILSFIYSLRIDTYLVQPRSDTAHLDVIAAVPILLIFPDMSTAVQPYSIRPVEPCKIRHRGHHILRIYMNLSHHNGLTLDSVTLRSTLHGRMTAPAQCERQCGY